MARGDHFFVWRRFRGVPFQHHAIDVGDGTAIHFAGEHDSTETSNDSSNTNGGIAGPGGDTDSFVILQTSIEQITREGRDPIYIVEHARRRSVDDTIRRAQNQVGMRGYHLLFNNCEHFANWCAVGSEESRQVSTACERTSAAGTKLAIATFARGSIRYGASHAIRRVSPWLLLADAAQVAIEAGGHHVGLTNPQQRKQVGRVLGGATAVGIGALSGPVGITLAGGVWLVGELAGEASRRVYVRNSGVR